MQTNRYGRLIVYSGPSGVGKGTVLAPLLAPGGPLTLSVSATTRAPRPGETDGVQYHFVSRAQFEQMIADDQMLEYAQYNGNYYGTPKRFVERQRAQGRDVVLEIETKGAAQVRRLCPDAVMIFLMPPSMRELSDRLRNRGTESAAQVADRLAAAGEEIKLAAQYDFVIVNDNPQIARERLLAAIGAADLLARFHQNTINEVLQHA